MSSVLRVFGADVERIPTTFGTELPQLAQLTLRQYYETQIYPAKTLCRAKSTISSDLTCIKRWEQYGWTHAKKWSLDKEWGKPTFRTIKGPDDQPIVLKNPPIGLIVSADLTAFVATLLQHHEVETVRTTVRTLSVIINHAGPCGPRHRHAMDVLLKCPAFPEVATQLKKKFIPNANHVRKLLDAAQTFKGASPRVTALVLLLSTYGIRSRDVCRLTWDNISEDLSEIQWTARKTERHRPYPMLAPLAPHVAQALSVLKRQPGKPLFWSYSYLVRIWRVLVRRAGYPETKTDSKGKKVLIFSAKTLRRYANDRLNAVRIGAGNWILGHAVDAKQRINHAHYSEVYEAPDWVRAAMMSPLLWSPLGIALPTGLSSPADPSDEGVG